MRYAALAIVAVTLLLTPCFVQDVSSSEDSENRLLVDYGNGNTDWFILYDDGSTLKNVLLDIFSTDISFSGYEIEKFNGYERFTLLNGEVCRWNIYMWDQNGWVWVQDASETYIGGYVAIAYCSSSGYMPPVTPDHDSAWTSFRGDSSSSGIGSSAPRFVATPIEWYNKVQSGGIYSTVLYADGYVYHTTGGSMSSIGKDQSSYTYCIDVENQKEVWQFKNCNYAGYEVSTPVIVGDLIIITSANWHVFCLDRFNGEPVAELLPTGTEAFLKDCPFYTYYDADISRSGITGPTTSAYDSGALYFNTADGRILCYTVDSVNGFDCVWEYYAGDGVVFYYSPPVITKASGMRLSISFDNAGTIYCLDADDGTLKWSGKTGKGSVTSISCTSDGRIAVAAASGLLIMDCIDGSVKSTCDVVTGRPVIIGSTLYGYCVPVSSDSSIVSQKTGSAIPVVDGMYAIDIDSMRCIWSTATEAYTKSGITYADGYLYCMDYYTDGVWPNGGCVRCYDPNTGTLMWSVHLDVNSQYSMCTAAIADGRIFVANDSGTMYVLSEVSSSPQDEPSEEKNGGPGLTHWSWILLFIITIAALALTVFAIKKV